MDEHDIQDLRKARSLAGWSYLGIILPLLGWILAGISLATSKHLEPKTTKAERRVRSVRRSAIWGMVISTVMFILYASLGVWTSYNNNREIKEQVKQQAQQAEQAANVERINAQSRQLLLSNCLDNVDKWYKENVEGLTTVFQEQNLLEQKAQEIDKCRLLYGD